MMPVQAKLFDYIAGDSRNPMDSHQTGSSFPKAPLAAL